MHMKNACSPTPQDVKIPTAPWAVEAATWTTAEMIDRIAHTGVRHLDDPAPACAAPVQLLTAIPAQPTEVVPPSPAVPGE